MSFFELVTDIWDALLLFSVPLLAFIGWFMSD
jgi:hypothetical protein